MKTSPCLYLLTCLAMAFLEGAFHGAYAEEQPVKYIFELSDEPVKVKPGENRHQKRFLPKIRARHLPGGAEAAGGHFPDAGGAGSAGKQGFHQYPYEQRQG